jgi:hypothetical protein
VSTAEEAAAILRESDDRTPAEQAALDALKKQLWVLWHAKDPNLGVVLLLSHAGLLRDKKQEAEEHKFAVGMAESSARDRRLEGQHTTALENLIDEAVKQLESGDTSGGVAAWMRERRTAVTEAVDKAKRAHLH